MNQRFPRRYRLLTSKQFDQVFKFGKKHRLNVLLIFTRENDLGHARIGFAVSKRRLRKAVDRNRVKRVIRESFRQMRSDLPALDIVVCAGFNIATVSNEELRRAFYSCLKKQCELFSSA